MANDPPTNSPAEGPEGDSVSWLLAQGLERWANMPPVTLRMDRQSAFLVLGCLQMLAKAPDSKIHPSMRDLVVAEGRRLRMEICDDEELCAAIEAGWRRPDHRHCAPGLFKKPR